MGRKESARLSVNITPEALELLRQVAARALYNEAAQPPVGEVVTAIVEFIDSDGEWELIEVAVRTRLMQKVEERKRKDRERKRKAQKS